ncbi:MAG: hypothetical protein MZW92_59835 [Comamonadaceae bacterium]|nr:hypothetical protein [Comamonadaceae bacterium]
MSHTAFISIGDLRRGGPPPATPAVRPAAAAASPRAARRPVPTTCRRTVWDKVKNHPCYSEEAHHHFARMHVAVAPACNIQCHYCNRKYDCANE